MRTFLRIPITEELAEIDPHGNATDENGDADESADLDTVLRRLSEGLDEPITVGDKVVYEDGDRHLLSDGDEKGVDSSADTDDAADDA